MQSVYALSRDPAEVRSDFAIGLKRGASQRGRGPLSEFPEYQFAPPFTPGSNGGQGVFQPIAFPVSAPGMTDAPVPVPAGCCPPPPPVQCPGSPRCLTSFPKDFLWQAAPAGRAQSMTRSNSWPGEGSVFGGDFAGKDKGWYERRGLAASRGRNPYKRDSWQHESWEDGWYSDSLRVEFGA